MVIGIDAREAAGRPAGKGRYVQEMLKHLPGLASDDSFFFYGHANPQIDLPSNVSWVSVTGSGLGWHRRVAAQARQECDRYFSTTSYLTPQFLKLPYVMTVYDLISFKDFAIPQKRARLIERRTLKRAAARAQAILTISQATATDLIAMFPDIKEKVTVTPLAADEGFHAQRSAPELAAVRRKYDLPESFVLVTGTVEPRKNLERLFAAFAELPPELRSQHALVVVGKKGWQSEPIFRAMEALKQTATVYWLDFVSDEDLAGLYAACTLFCYPSLYEGFGLPVLEAMQSGAPVITSNVSSLPEVGGDAVRYVNPTHIGELVEALDELLTTAQPRQELARAGIERATDFSWQATALETLKVLRGV